jgi:hypothetical protein
LSPRSAQSKKEVCSRDRNTCTFTVGIPKGEQTGLGGIILLRHMSEVRNFTEFMWLRIWSVGHW